MNESNGALYAALAKAQGAMHNVPRDAENPFYKSRYATMSACMDVVRAPLAENGLCVIQQIVNGDNGSVGVETIIGHESGAEIRSTFYVTPAKPDAQAVGSATTYLRRYGLMAMLGLAADDDDGNEASTPPRQESAEPPPPPPPAKVTCPERLHALCGEMLELIIQKEPDYPGDVDNVYRALLGRCNGRPSKLTPEFILAEIEKARADLGLPVDRLST